ncbi:hypothetical protein DY000_02041837 [Brassica cretica]|uniref:Uncharacterized protein n=1 Tax=Brassica cretica TaxID=69181 RepID=A0ABQ7BPY9_BRACR|nr:hypothetical protein DY000_02041837 [Brassica cretica]
MDRVRHNDHFSPLPVTTASSTCCELCLVPAPNGRCRAVSQTRNQRSCPSPLNFERCLWTAVTTRCRSLVELDFLFFAMAKPSQSSKHHHVLLDPATARSSPPPPRALSS